MIWCSLNLLFRIEASWCHSRPETSSFQWQRFKGGLQLEAVPAAFFLCQAVFVNCNTSNSWRNVAVRVWSFHIEFEHTKERAAVKRAGLGQSIVITSTGYGIKTVVYGSQVWIVAITILLLSRIARLGNCQCSDSSPGDVKVCV